MFPGGQTKNVLSHPNTLTLFRVAAVPLIVILLMFPSRICTFIAALIFTAAAITDFLDGFFARKRGLVSNFGKVMDPVADKGSGFYLFYYAYVPRVDTGMDCLHHYRA